MRVIVTGGAGFIGSALVRYLVLERGYDVLTIDALTYTGCQASLKEVEGTANHRFLDTNICDRAAMDAAIAQFRPDRIMHLAAESHVSTDEVYGSLGDEGLFEETTPYDPSSPYSASKAASDHLAKAWHRTYGMPIVVSNCSNNYGPYHFPEKLIPLTILNALEGRTLPVYWQGREYPRLALRRRSCPRARPHRRKADAGRNLQCRWPQRTQEYRRGAPDLRGARQASPHWRAARHAHRICDRSTGP